MSRAERKLLLQVGLQYSSSGDYPNERRINGLVRFGDILKHHTTSESHPRSVRVKKKMKTHIVSEKNVCWHCLGGDHGDCGGAISIQPNWCICKRYKHKNIQIREQLPVKKRRGSWKPPTHGTSGELAAADALTKAGIHYTMQVPITTKFTPFAYCVDFLIEGRLIYECQGMLHYKTWGGRVAHSRMRKDRAKRNCLIAEGYPFCETTDKFVKTRPDEFITIIRDALANPEKYKQLEAKDRAELEENKP